MRREELTELHYITPIENVGSILKYGILSHQRSGRLAHRSIAMQNIQDRRVAVTIPGGRKLHEYVNLYICSRNPMMYKRKGDHRTICVLQVNPEVLDLPGVVLTDQNASSSYARFAAAPEGLSLIDAQLVYARSWVHPDDQIQEWRHKAIKCAEVLVPDRVDPSLIAGIYVSCQEAHAAVRRAGALVQLRIDADLFFL